MQTVCFYEMPIETGGFNELLFVCQNINMPEFQKAVTYWNHVNKMRSCLAYTYVCVQITVAQPKMFCILFAFSQMAFFNCTDSVAILYCSRLLLLIDPFICLSRPNKLFYKNFRSYKKSHTRTKIYSQNFLVYKVLLLIPIW